MWREQAGRLQRDFEFRDFKSAWAFMSEVAKIAEELNHHPDWSNSYNKVSISLTSHDANKVTKRDRESARRIDVAAQRFSR